ncbi:MAG: DEAD/DEAH box helicase, partial [Deferribacterales bacterium]
IGRTGRAGKEGTAITFVTPEEYRKLLYIMKIAKADIKKKKVPSIQEVINAKKERINDELNEIISEQLTDDYIELAQKLLNEYDPVHLVSALLKMNYKDDFEINSYSEISEVSKIDNKGKARLFIAMGKTDNMTPKKIVDFIVEKTGIKDSDIKEVKVFDKFSFISVPYEDATYIVNFFKKQNRGKRPLVEIAKEKENKR